MIASGGTSRSQPGWGLSLQAATGRAAPSRLKHVGSWQQAVSRLAGDSCWDKEWGWRQVLRPWGVWVDWGTKGTCIQVGSHCSPQPPPLGFPFWLYFDHTPKYLPASLWIFFKRPMGSSKSYSGVEQSYCLRQVVLVGHRDSFHLPSHCLDCNKMFKKKWNH